MKNLLKNYINDLKTALDNLDHQKIKEISNKLIEAKVNHNSVFLIGNGGSSATPSHSAGDWTKELKIKTICLTDNASAVTAFGNDTAYDNIFKGQLETFLEPGDIVIGYSGSGNSENVLKAIQYSIEKGNFTIGITGNYKSRKGGKLAKLADISLIVNTTSMERIEDVHLIINHMIKDYIKEYLSERNE
ncbi:MAG: SIS domain-containing protein [Armatimonadetes bacterium]|nr:SIS domain-containing protein [Armatimonadota bacterium]